MLENICTQLTDLGADRGDLVDVTCYLVSMTDFGRFNEIYNSYFNATTGPTRTKVAVHQLPHPYILVEIKVTAFKPRV